MKSLQLTDSNATPFRLYNRIDAMTTVVQMYAFMAVETEIPWPEVETLVEFDGRSITLRPATKERMADIVIPYSDPETLQQAVSVGNAYLSQLSWHARMPARLVDYCGASFPGAGISTMRTQYVSSKFRLDFKPVPTTKKQRLALALYREAKGIKSVPYGVLGFYKVIKLLFPRDKRGRVQMSWINGHTSKITNYLAATKLKELAAAGEDVGKYIYADVRCAIAHANQNPTINPDNADDIVRLQGDLPLLDAVARYAIEIEFGIKSESTFRREHKYELKGFRPFLDSKLVKGLAKKKGPRGQLPKLEIAIKMRDKEQLSAFANLKLTDVTAHGHSGVKLWLKSPDELVTAALLLDRDSERLLFDPMNGARITDDGSATAARYEMDRHLIVIDWLCNGETEVYSRDGRLLGISAPYVPENIDLTGSVRSFRSALKQIQSIYSQRFVQQFGAK